MRLAFAGRIPKPERKLGFTLIELMVSITLIMVLAGLAVLFIPTIGDQARAGRGAQQLQGWLNIAKQRALRDQAPRGIRLVRSDDNPNLVVNCFAIEQPDDFTGGQISTSADGASIVTVSGGVDLYNGNIGDDTLWEVRPGDYLEINGGGLLRRITALPSSNTFWVEVPIAFKLEPTSTYRIIRRPRILGDEKLEMPLNTAIDLKTNADNGNPLPPGPTASEVDIVFAPSGQVMTSGLTNEYIALWVRDTSDVLNPDTGVPAIIAVFVRTGLVGSFPVATPPALPYSLIK